MDKEKQQIEEAFELIKDLNFQIFVDRLAKYQTEDILKECFGGSVKEVPDISRIYSEFESNNARTLSYIEDYVNFPDAKLRLQNHLGQLARILLFNGEHLNKIRQGETIWLNMELAGQLWSHSEMLKKYRPVLHNFEKLKKKPLPTLEDIFSDKKQLRKLVEVLIKKGFVHRKENGSLFWTGIKHDQAKASGSQLIALTDICKPLYKKANYEQKELHHAWTTYFNFKISVVMFSGTKRPPEGSQYHRLFTHILNSI